MYAHHQLCLFGDATSATAPLSPPQALHAIAEASIATAAAACGEAIDAAAVDPRLQSRAIFESVINLSTEEKITRSKGAINRLFDAGHTVACAWSSGKDSTVLLYLLLEVAVERKALGLPVTQILVTHASTQIDNPAYEKVTRGEIAKVRAYIEQHQLPARLDVATPALNDTWAVRIISGRALPTFANSATRDCSIVLKILPQQRQRKAALRELAAAGAPVVLVGTRYEESPARMARMLDRQERDDEIWVDEVRSPDGKLLRNELRLSPICFYSQEDVWVILSELVGGMRKSYTDAAEIWEAYKDGGNTSCAVVSDDVMKANSKACGARFGCATCAAVGRDKSLESMLAADEKYAYMRNLNRLQNYIVDTQYDMRLRQWLGRTITKDGYLGIAPDAYSPAMQRSLLRFSLTLDRDEAAAASKLRIAPRFQLVSLKQLVAIDIIWSMQGHQPRPFEAWHIWCEVNEQGKSFYPPKVEATAAAESKIPKPKWLYVGRDYDSDDGYSDLYTGARHLMADFVGATESGGCQANIELSDGRVVMGIDKSSFFEVDEAGAEEFMVWEILDERLHEKTAHLDSGIAFTHYQMFGTFSTSSKHLGDQDYMLRRADWKRRHGVFKMSRDELLAHSVDDAQRAAGIRAPDGAMSLPDQLAKRLAAEHARRTATRWRAPEEATI